MLSFFIIWFFSSASSFLALVLHMKGLLKNDYNAEDELWCFIFALFLGPIPLFTVFGISLWRLIKE